MQEPGQPKYNKGLMKIWPETARFDLPEAGKEYSSFSYIWCLKARCHRCYTVGLVCFPCRSDQEIPKHKHKTITFQWPTSVSKRRSEKSLLCDKYACNMTKLSWTVTTLPWEGRSHLLNWWQNWHLQRLLYIKYGLLTSYQRKLPLKQH